MNKTFIIIVIIMLLLVSCSKKNTVYDVITANMKDINGTFVMIDLNSDKEIIFNKNLSETKTTPYSTFKIWNTLIGLETNLINLTDESFYKWDGVTRLIPEWNKDLTLKEAFQVSCVPAYQNLANKIGVEKMQLWIDKINYGNKDISSGLDIFWLPRPQKKSILISPKEQTLLIKKLINNQLPFSDKSIESIKTIMLYKTEKNGTLYGKTGSGNNVGDIIGNNIGWYVGYVMSKNGNYAFSCLIYDKNIKGSDVKSLVEKILIESKLL